MTSQRFTDAQIFFVALLGFCIARLSGAFLTWLTALPTGDADASLVARIAPQSSTSPIYLFFVLLPVALAVFAIGIPFLLRTLLAASRRTLARREALGLGLVGAAVVVATAVHAFAGTAAGLELLGCMALIGFWQSWQPLGHRGGMLGMRLLGAAGVSLIVVAYYETALLAGGDPSVAVGPTFVVLAVAFAAAGLPLVSASALVRTVRPGWPTAVVVWAAALLWSSASSLRRTADGPWPADRLELRANAVVAVLLVLPWAVAEYRRRRDARFFGGGRGHDRA